jgi:RNA-directed DNA polymerase
VRSQDTQRRQPTPQGASRQEAAVMPPGPDGEPSVPTAQTRAESRGEPDTRLMERIVERENLFAALKRVEQNGGAPGVDGMSCKELRPYLKDHWPRIRQELLAGNYRPQPVRRVEIPKPDGGVRQLGIPTVLDRFIQQAMLQVLTPLFDPMFSAHSYGFRPGKRAHDAVRAARRFIQDGYTWVVDLDLEKFFDRVQHDRLMVRVARRVEDKRVLRLIRRYLEAGVMLNGVKVATEEGTPQGGPLSPLLANVMLDDLDKELERRGHKFARYADDCNIYVRSQRAGERVMKSVRAYLETRLGLKVNEGKSAVERPWKRKFLGFSFYRHKGEVRIRLAPQSLTRVKAKIRALTSRRHSQSMKDRLQRLGGYLGGWLGYFALADTPSTFDTLDQWIRRRLRMCLWKQWKRVRTRKRELATLGLPDRAAWMFANTRKGYWRSANTPQVHQTLGLAYWRAQGLVSLLERYQEIRETWRTAGCGPACPVV